jgi:hypothetical protein
MTSGIIFANLLTPGGKVLFPFLDFILRQELFLAAWSENSLIPALPTCCVLHSLFLVTGHYSHFHFFTIYIDISKTRIFCLRHSTLRYSTG